LTGYGMSSSELRLLEIDDAKIRHEWAKAEMRRVGDSPALVRFVAESLKELRILELGKRPTLLKLC
jgi:hypothetical protein